MANEAVCIETPKIIKRYTVTDGVAIPYGTILAISGGTVSVNVAKATSNTLNEAFAGIAIEEKTASDGITEIGAAIDGVWDLAQNANGAGTVGTMCCLSGANIVRTAAAGDLLTGGLVGKYLETGTAGAANRVRLGVI